MRQRRAGETTRCQENLQVLGLRKTGLKCVGIGRTGLIDVDKELIK